MVNPLIHHNVPSRRSVQDVELNRICSPQKWLNKLPDGIMSDARLHRNIVIETVFGHVAEHLIGILVCPCQAKISHQLFVLCAHHGPPFSGVGMFCLWACPYYLAEIPY